MPTRQTFNWSTEIGSTVSQKPRVQVTKFGDGYEARSAYGINNAPETWAVKCTQTTGNSEIALAFVKARNGVESFYWENPHGATGLYVCREWSTENLGQARTLNMTFEQVFDL